MFLMQVFLIRRCLPARDSLLGMREIQLFVVLRHQTILPNNVVALVHMYDCTYYKAQYTVLVHFVVHVDSTYSTFIHISIVDTCTNMYLISVHHHIIINRVCTHKVVHSIPILLCCLLVLKFVLVLISWQIYVMNQSAYYLKYEV